MKVIKKILSKNYLKDLKMSKYYNYVINYKLHKNNIFIECNNIDIISDILKSELNEKYNIYITSKEKIDCENFVLYESSKYYKLLSNCKYIITDSLLNDWYIKKDNQVVISYFNINRDDYLGRYSEDNYFDIGNIQRTLMNSDYIIFNSKESNIINNYMVDNLVNGKIIYSKLFIKTIENIIFDNKLKYEELRINNKENILIYGGNLAKNGITSSLKNLLSSVDLDKRNYYVVYDTKTALKNKDVVLSLPQKVKYLAINSNTIMDFKTNIKFHMFRANIIKINGIEKEIIKSYKLDIKRLFPQMKVDSAIQFGGYDFRKIFLFSAFDSNRIIYVHSNMLDEIKLRHIQHRRTLEYAYNKYDKVAIVSDAMYESTYKISKNKDNIFTAVNLIDYKGIINKSKEEIKFDDYTTCNIQFDKLKEILNTNSKKFISIGRFSKEKGHERLINSFNRIYKENKDVYLIIIGGEGKEYDKTISLINSLDCKNNIIIIKNISNPYSILSKCNYFVLSSFYEGFGLVLAEADILGLSVISTDIDGPRKFMNDNNGVMVDNNEDGIYYGMCKLLNNEIKPMNVDYEDYNKKALKEFYNLLDGGKYEK